MSIEITGNWKKGIAYDVHTLSSTYLGPNEHGHDQWENTRSEMGELIYQLKYNGDESAIPQILKLLEKIKGIDTMDYIVPIPPTNRARGIQPVPAIAKALGEQYKIDVLEDLIIKSSGGPELKNVNDCEERIRLLRVKMSFSGQDDVTQKNVLLVDDLYRSGAILTVATELLYQQGNAANVSVLTMTKTRSNR